MTTHSAEKNDIIAFSFGEPEPLSNPMSTIMEQFLNVDDSYIVPPVDMDGLSKMGTANATHQRCITFKTNQMAIVYKSGLLSKRDFRRVCKDLNTFGNAYIQVFKNLLGRIVRLGHIPARKMRKSTKQDVFLMLKGQGEHIEFRPNEVVQLVNYDTGQQAYGLPDWFGALQDVFLNSEATLFRRRYFLNGSHMGYILYTNDENITPEAEKSLRNAISRGKGAGNFKSMFINIPGGNEKAVQLIPVGDISQKDEFEKIKNISADDIVIAHGVQPALAGIKPENTGGFGDIAKIEKFYRQNEVRALIEPFEELNEVLSDKGVEINNLFKFDFDLNLVESNSGT